MRDAQGLRENFQWGVPVARSARPAVQANGGSVEFLLAAGRPGDLRPL
jgi:hypothetical protein